jgi:hypothetical protein
VVPSHDRRPADRYGDLPEGTRDFIEGLRAEDIAEFERVLQVSRAKRLIWDFLLKLSGAITVVGGAVYTYLQFFGGSKHP